jgi:hypothetical protein
MKYEAKLKLPRGEFYAPAVKPVAIALGMTTTEASTQGEFYIKGTAEQMRSFSIIIDTIRKETSKMKYRKIAIKALDLALDVMVGT